MAALNRFPLSYSRLTTFENCPLKFDYLHVTKSVKDEGSTHSEYGNRVHEQLEAYGKTGDPSVLGDDTRKYARLVDRIRAQPGDKYFELKMAVDANGGPCDWFSEDVWIRAIADVLVVDGDTAFCLDWKTGKVRDDPTQLQLFACMVMFLYPEVNRVKTAFMWIKHNSSTQAEYTRDQLGSLWGKFERKFLRVQEAVDLGFFEPRPNPLCNWCPARKVCQYAK